MYEKWLVSPLNSDIPPQYEALSVHNAVCIQCLHHSLVFQCSLFNTKTLQLRRNINCSTSKVTTCWKMNHDLISHCAAVKIHSLVLTQSPPLLFLQTGDCFVCDIWLH